MNAHQAHEYIRKRIEADDYTMHVFCYNKLETRFAQNAITQHMNGDFEHVSLQVAFGNRSGIATANRLDEETLDWLIDTAQQIARVNEPDPEYVPSEGACELPPSDDFDEAVAAYPVEKMVDGIIACVRNAEGQDAKVSGLSTRFSRTWNAFSKNGFDGEDRDTFFEHSMTLKKGEAETKVSQGVNRMAQFSMAALIDQLNDQFIALRNPGTVEAGKHTVILRPQAVENLFGMMNYTLDRRQADEGVTPFTDQLGKPFFGERFSLLSTRDDADMVAMPFTNQLLPTRTTHWVRNGVLENQPMDRYWANKVNAEPLARFNTLIPGGAATEEEMMKQAGSGLIVNNFWYIRFIDQKRGEVTGMTRDGVMRFENGKLVGAVNNLRWNEVMHEVTRRILALGPAVLLSPYSKVPTMLIQDFNFVDTTTF